MKGRRNCFVENQRFEESSGEPIVEGRGKGTFSISVLPKTFCQALLLASGKYSKRIIMFFLELWYTLQRHCTENSKQIHVFLELKLHGFVPNFYIHVNMSDLYIPTIVLQSLLSILLQKNTDTDQGPKLIVGGHASICVKYLFSKVDDFCAFCFFLMKRVSGSGSGRLQDLICDCPNFKVGNSNILDYMTIQ